jgi:SAM-dependent methyltransferase
MRRRRAPVTRVAPPQRFPSFPPFPISRAMTRQYPTFPPATLGLRLPDASPARVEPLQSEVERLGAAAQYGWGHTIDFGPFRKEGLLKDSYLAIAGGFDAMGWWPPRLDGMRVADIGCFTGGIALLMAERGAEVVYAVDEIPEHVSQCELVARAFGASAVRPVCKSLFGLPEAVPSGSLDLIVLSGVLYHLSDMLVGLHVLRELLKPGGVLLIESNGVDDFEHSYANFGRFYGGMWWQPTGLCIQDMCSFMAFRDCDVRFYVPDRCIARAVRAEGGIPFRRGLNASFASLRDAHDRSLDPAIMAPAPLR